MPRAQLLELSARGLGVIDDARVEFGSGFNVITGETGAGKTLLLGALELCLGSEGATSRQAVTGETHVAAVFRRRDDSEVVLTRESGARGRLRSAVNGVASSAEALRALGQELVVVNGQHESLALQKRGEALRLLDRTGDVSTEELSAVRRQLRVARAERDGLGGDTERRARELAFLDYQIAEVAGVKIVGSDELTAALTELARQCELRDGQVALGAALGDLDGDDDAVLARLARAIVRLPAGSAYDEQRAELRAALERAREAVRDLAVLADGAEFDGAGIAVLEDRVTVLQGVARKHGGSLESALASLERMRGERAALLGAADRVEELDGEIAELGARERDVAAAVRREREVAAATLTTAVARQLPRVALAHATLRFVVEGDDGGEVQILFTPNPGRPEGPLPSLASGGELSRVQLALALETVHDDVVAVFDEVDAGVGGQVAQQIGECLRELGHEQQVLAVTHLASVAAKADHHVVIDKSIRGSTTTTIVREVTGEDRVREIARMMVGDRVTEESLALATQLLETVNS
ncbi:MAG: AAA family ATPase [Acidimicrobiales bacterium]